MSVLILATFSGVNSISLCSAFTCSSIITISSSSVGAFADHPQSFPHRDSMYFLPYSCLISQIFIDFSGFCFTFSLCFEFSSKCNCCNYSSYKWCCQYSHKFSTTPDNNAGARARAGFIDAPEINDKNKISNPTIPPIATPLNPLKPFVYTT